MPRPTTTSATQYKSEMAHKPVAEHRRATYAAKARRWRRGFDSLASAPRSRGWHARCHFWYGELCSGLGFHDVDIGSLAVGRERGRARGLRLGAERGGGGARSV